MGSFAAAPPHYARSTKIAEVNMLRELLARAFVFNRVKSEISSFFYRWDARIYIAPPHMRMRTVAGQTLSRSYGRYLAEFLNEGSPEHLGLLDLSTCVSLRYGRRTLLTYVFSCQFGPREFRSYDQFHSCLTTVNCDYLLRRIWPAIRSRFHPAST